MASDRFEDRLQESNKFLDGQYDQREAEKRRAQQSAALFKAIQEKDYDTARSIQGIPPAEPIDADIDSSPASEESPDALVARMHGLRQNIENGIEQCTLLPSGLRNDWRDRLANLTDTNCVSELEALRRDVQVAFERRSLYFDHRQVSKSMALEGDLRLLEMELRSLRDQCSRYFSMLR